MKKLVTVLFTVFMVVSVAGVTGQIAEERVDTASTGINIEQGELYQKGFLDRISDSLLSFSGVQSTYEPGEEVNVEIEAETTQTYDTADATKVVKVYKCADSGCDDPAPINSADEDSCSEAEWPNYDDCIARNTDQVSFSVVQDEGTSWSWDTSFNGFDQEGTYILQGYIYTYSDSEGWNQVTDVSEEKFTVQSSTTSDPDDGSSTSPEEPSIETTRATEVDVRGNTIESTTYIENTGGDMQEEWLIEMQPVLVEEASWYDGILSSVSTRQMTCDLDNPENVHKTYQLDSGESATIQLESTDLTAGNYDVKMVSATGCAPTEDNVESTGPFGWSSVVDNVDVEQDVPEIVEYRQPNVEVDDESGEVTGTVYFENEGDADMPESFIVEMQIRDRQGNLLSIVGEQGTCDPNSPENVHKPFQLDVGDRESIDLVSQVPEDGVYDISFVTSTDCMNDGDGLFVEPYKGSSEAVVNDVAVSTGTDGSGDDDNGDGDLPLIPIGLIALGLTIVLGGVYLR